MVGGKTLKTVQIFIVFYNSSNITVSLSQQIHVLFLCELIRDSAELLRLETLKIEFAVKTN